MNRAILCDFSKPFKSIHPQGPGFQTQPYENCGAIWRPAGAATRHGDKPLTVADATLKQTEWPQQFSYLSYYH